jgi:hypothetical protein
MHGWTGANDTSGRSRPFTNQEARDTEKRMTMSLLTFKEFHLADRGVGG